MQIFPVENVRSSQHTSVRVLYDDDNLYVGVRCDDTGAVTSRLARRDNFNIPADWVSIAIDSRLDGKDAFVFQAYASGTLADAVRFNDTDFDPSWDGVWDARSRIDSRGWSVEFSIPLRVLRFTAAPEQVWGFEVKRNIQRRLETDYSSYIPREGGREVSAYGRLVGLSGLHPPRDVEIAPFIVARQTSYSYLAPGDPHVPFESALTAGLNAKVGVTSNLTLDATVNPDFGEVEADQVVLNLTTFETYYPEKRPFFLEGADLFSLPIQIFYSRRIGRPPTGPPVADGAQIVSQPPVTTIFGAAKISGRLTPKLAIAALDAVTAGESALVSAPTDYGIAGPGMAQVRTAEVPANFGVLRLREELPFESSVGMAATTVTRFDDRAMARGCPGDVTPGTDGRCTHDAYVGSLDATLKSPSEDYALVAQLLGSKLVGGPLIQVPDGNFVGAGSSGVGGTLKLRKQGGEHWLWDAEETVYSPALEINDAGYSQQANYQNYYQQLTYRTVKPTRHTLSTSSQVMAWENFDWYGHRLETGGQLNSYQMFPSFWSLYSELDLGATRWDNRETRDGSYMERAGYLGAGFGLNSDSRAPLQLSAGGGGGYSPRVGDWLIQGNGTLSVRAPAQLSLDIIPTVSDARDLRWVETDPDPTGGRRYVFGFQNALSLGATVRGTYTFTPRLTLQIYGQMFLARVSYDHFFAFVAPPAGRVDIPMARMRPDPTFAGNPGGEDKALNVNVVLRWEYALGSELFLVYTRSQMALPYSGFGPPSLNAAPLFHGPAVDTFLLKLSYFWS